MNFVANFKHVGPYNAMLVHIQKPGSTYVASAADWEQKFGRTVKPGARPLLILKPFGPVSFVFEYMDTEGAPLPDVLVRPFKNDAPITQFQMNQLIVGAGYDGIAVVRQQYGTNYAGHIQFAETASKLCFSGTKNQLFIKSNYTIVLNENMPISEQFTTMLHELGHFYCGHINVNDMTWLPRRIYLNENEGEFEAETVCWLVCKRLGIENNSVPYLDQYLEKNEYIPSVSIDSILKAAGIIESCLTGSKMPRKELVIKDEK